MGFRVLRTVTCLGLSKARLARVLSVATLAGLLISLLGFSLIAAPAGAAVASTSNALPAKDVSGVTQLCGPSPSYSCDTGGYAGQSTSWWGAYYGAGYASSNAYGYHNCTLYAAYRIAQNGVGNPGWSANASGWATAASAHGTPVNQTPAVGAIAQWNRNHVAYVEVVTPSYIEITDDSYGYNTTDRFRIAVGSPAWPDNFIHFKDLSPAAPGVQEVATSDGHIQVFSDANGTLQENWYDPATGDIGGGSSVGGMTVQGTPALVARSGQDVIDAFIRNSAGQIMETWYNWGTGGWGGWITVNGGTFTSDPSAVATSDGHDQVFADNNGAIEQNWFDPGTGDIGNWVTI